MFVEVYLLEYGEPTGADYVTHAGHVDPTCVAAKMTCPDCYGTGVSRWDPACVFCKGTGEVWFGL